MSLKGAECRSRPDSQEARVGRKAKQRPKLRNSTNPKRRLFWVSRLCLNQMRTTYVVTGPDPHIQQWAPLPSPR